MRDLVSLLIRIASWLALGFWFFATGILLYFLVIAWSQPSGGLTRSGLNTYVWLTLCLLPSGIILRGIAVYLDMKEAGTG
jgi:hypothetical protein